jgi:outer membrane protein
MKDMRARIRAPFALLTAFLLVFGATTPFAAAQTAPPAQQTLQLSLDEAVKRALDNNADIVVARYDPQLSEQLVRSAAGYYDPYLTGTYQRSSSDAKATSPFSGGNYKTDTWNFGAVAPVEPTGGNVQLSFNNSRSDTDNAYTTFNPTFASRLTLTLTQPLLRNFLMDSPRQQLQIAKKNREISDVQFHATVVNTIAGVKGAYYNLIYAIDNLTAARKSLDLAKRLLNENEIRVKVGTMAPLDIVTAQAEVASREEGVIVAENTVGDAEDTLKQTIFPRNDPATWATRIVPTDRPTAEPVPVDAEAAVRSALENRTDVVAARKGLERSDISLKYSRNQLLPDLNLVASYGAAGTGGTELTRDPALGGPVVSTVPGGYGDAISEVFGRDYPTWSIGVNVAYAIPNRSAKAAAAQAQISKDQALASYRRLELSVAAEVRTAARAVESGFKRVGTTHAASTLAAQRLDAEEKKFAAGMSTNFLVMQAQRDLATAEVAELQAIADYRKSVINFQRVQEAGVSSGAASITLVSGSSAQSTAALRSGQAATSVQSTTGGF